MSDRPHHGGGMFSVLGVDLTALLAALLLILIAVSVFPSQQTVASVAAYLPLHAVVQMFAIIVSILVFAVGWVAYSRERVGNSMLLSCAFLAVGLMDFAYTMSFPGMPDFVTPSSEGKAIDFWLAARGLAACALLFAAVRPWRPFASPRTRYWLLVAALGITALVYWLILYFEGALPATFIPGQGPTPFKTGAEYTLIAVYVLAAAVFFVRLRIEHADYLRRLFTACCVIMLSELYFIFYGDVADINNLPGHIYDAIAYLLIYQALSVRGTQEPYQRLQQSRQPRRATMERRRRGLVSDWWRVGLSPDWYREQDGAAAQAMLAAIVENSNTAIIGCALDSTILSWNAAAEQMFGWSAKEAIGQPIAIITQQQHHGRLQPLCDQAARGEPVGQVESCYLRRDGACIDTAGTLVAIRDANGETVFFTLTLSDITQQKQLERTMREGEERFRAAFEQAGVGMALRGIDPRNPRWLRVNQKLCDILGYTREELLQLTSVELTPPDERQVAIDYNQKLRSGELTNFSREKRYVRKDGRIIWANITLTPVSGPDGRPSHLISVIQDITARKQAEERLRKVDRARRVIGECNRVMVRADDEMQLLQDMCKTAVESGGYRMAWVGFAEHDAFKSVRPVAQAGFDEGYLDAARISWGDTERGRGPSGRAIRLGETYVVRNALTDPNFAPWREHALARGYRSHIALPLARQGVTFGVLSLYAAELDAFDADEIALLGELAADLAYGIVSLRTRVEHAHAERVRAQLAAIVENSYDAIASRTLDRRILTWNAAAERLFGYTADEARNRDILSEIIPADRQAEVAQKRALLERGLPTPPYDSVRLTKDGRRVDVSIRQSPIYDANGKLTGVSLVFHDIAERKQAEAERAQLAAIVESSQDAIVGRRLDGTITSWNAGAERIFGYTKAEAVGRHITLLIPPEQRDGFEANQKLLRDGRERPPFESIQLAKDGRRIPVSVSISCIRDAQGRVMGVSIIVHDITERNRTKQQILKLNAELEQRVMERTQQLAAINKELEAFSYSVSHDLRTPLRGIDGFSQMLLKKYAGQLDETGNDYLQRIRNACTRMGDLINDLLQLSRVSASKLETERVDLSQLARSILAELRRGEPERKVEIEVQDGMAISADPRLLRIALENLLGNAWKFTGKKAVAIIRVGSAQQEGNQVIFIKDNGAGFNMKYAHKLYGAFQRLHSAAEFEGTGIGLATVQRVLNLHGGRIWADSAPGEGTSFYFVIPPAGGSATATP